MRPIRSATSRDGQMVGLASLAMVLFVTATADPGAATTYVVRPDGTGDFDTIQAAIHGVASGDTIELADGIFLGEGNRDIDFGGRAVTVCSQSGNPETCIIDAEGTDLETHRVFIFTSGEGSGSVVRDLTISGALVNGC